MPKRSSSLQFRPWLALSLLAIFIISFQNFAPIPFDQLNPSLNLAQAARRRAAQESGEHKSGQDTRDGGDIRDWAPTRPGSLSPTSASIALPEASSDLGSIERSWLTNQTHLLTGGADQKMLDDLNKRLNRWVKFEPVEGEPWPEPGDDSAAADSGAGPGASGDDESGEKKPDMSGLQDLFSMAPKSIRFSQVNRFQLDFKNQSRMSCLITGGGVKLDVSKPIGNRVDVGLAHDMAAKSSTVHLQYTW